MTILLPVFLLCCLAPQLFAGSSKFKEMINCKIQTSACSQKVADVEVILDIRPRPVKAMEELTFRVLVRSYEPTADPYIDLGMPGMDMGPNRVQMSATSKGLYLGTGIIVRCKSGRTVWQATVTIPGLGKAEYIFDVVY